VLQHDQGSALAELKRGGLVGEVRTAEVAGAKEGTVTSQDPPPDTVVDVGSVVVVTVAKAPPPPPRSVLVPQVVRMEVADAQRVIERAELGFTGKDLGEVRAMKCGTTAVRSTDPAGGDAVPAGTPVTVSYERGPRCDLRAPG
jgi:beta-lactam-binding protein with PASTA domain